MERIGKYRILEKLGQGGMGVVYKALDTLLERVVAVKMVSTNLDADPELRTRFFREGRAAGQLSHRNIVTIFDLGEENGTAYIAMEFLEGEDLRTRLHRSEPMDLRSKIRIMTEVCEGLAHAHERDVIHRDIKPANIFVTRSGPVKILDFGLARTISSDLTSGGRAMGTPNYMSPEQVRGEKVDNRTDIFSLGVSFYELLTHRKAFQGDSFTSTIFKILQNDPTPIENIDPTIPPELCTLVYKALTKDREQRYRNLGEVLRDIKMLGGTTESDLPILPSDPDLRAFDSTAPRSNQKHAPRSPANEGPSAAMLAPGGEAETLSQPPQSQGHRRHMVGIAVASLVLGGVLWALFELRLVWISPPASVSAALPAPASSPTMMPKPPPSPAPPVAEAQPAQASDEELQGGLERASNALRSFRFSDAAREAEEVLNRSPENAEAGSILRKARENMNAVSSAIRDAKTYIAAGDYGHARAATEKVLALAPSDGEALQLRRRLDEIARKDAERALAQIGDAKAKAEAAGAPELAFQPFGAAQSREGEANHLFGAGRYGEAAAKSAETIELYRHAESAAQTERDLRMENSRRAEAERRVNLQRAGSETARQAFERDRDSAVQAGAGDKARDQFAEAEKLADSARQKAATGDFEGAMHDYEAATSAMEQARTHALDALRKEAARPPVPPVSPATVTTGQPPAASRETLESVQKAISDVLDRYKTAMETKDVGLLKSIWPALGTQQEQAFKQQWSYTRSLRVAFRRSKVERWEDASATVTVQLHNEQQIDDGTSRRWDQKATFSFVRKGRSWLIDSAGFEAMR